MNAQENNTGDAVVAEDGKVKKEIFIVVNGSRKRVQKSHYTYEELFDLAFPGEAIPEGYDEPITYSLPHQHVEGHLLRGQHPLELHEGEVINVIPTHKS